MRNVLKLILGFLVVILVFLIGGGVYAYTQLQPVQSDKKTKVTFVVPRGQSISSIGKRLQEQGLIRNSLAFRYVVWSDRLSDKIQAGSFLLSPSMSTQEVAQELTMGTNDIWITVLEGWRVEEIADMLEEQALTDFDKKEFLQLAKGEEGYLFPDSYLISPSASPKIIHTLLRNTFDKKVKQGLSEEIAQSGQDLDDIVTMASIVQREAREFDQMKRVAGILQNRIKKGMGLNVDATLQYTKGYDTTLKTWWPEPLAADKESTSPFNTYKFAGLPPHPISNPGLEAIQAVLAPEKTNALYYIHDRQGNIHTANTIEEHNQNVNTYLR
jgi:UPF0755 protein